MTSPVELSFWQAPLDWRVLRSQSQREARGHCNCAGQLTSRQKFGTAKMDRICRYQFTSVLNADSRELDIPKYSSPTVVADILIEECTTLVPFGYTSHLRSNSFSISNTSRVRIEDSGPYITNAVHTKGYQLEPNGTFAGIDTRSGSLFLVASKFNRTV